MTSKLLQMQARFQQKQIQEKEEKLLKLYENQQQRVFDRVGKNSAGSTGSLGSTTSNGGGKVRQLFEERRQKAGIDRSYPLEPLRTSNEKISKTSPPKNGRTNGNVTTTVRRTNTITSTRTSQNGTTVRPAITQQTRSEEMSYYSGNNNNHYNDTDDFNIPTRDTDPLVDMMNNHNLTDSLEDEILPDLVDDQIDGDFKPNRESAVVIGKLSNLGGKLPSEVVPKKKETKTSTGGSSLKNSNTFRKDTKVTVARKSPSVITKTAPGPTVRKSSSLSSNNSSTHSSPAKSTPNTMAQRPPQRPASNTPRQPTDGGDRGVASASSGASRTPNTSRPSARQTPRGPSAVARDDLDACRYCQRRFATDRLAKHEDICARTAKKKRKVYDATKHRVGGTELEQYIVKKPRAGSNKPKTATKANNWRQKHEEFISAIRAAKTAQAHVAKGGKLSDLPPPPPSTNPDYVQCPHCGRRFNEAAAERHIPKCASYSFNKGPAKPQGGAGRGGRTSAR